VGHQIALYLSLKDATDLERELLRPDEDLILKSRSRGPFPSCVTSIDLVADGNRLYFFYFARCVDLDTIVTREVPAQGYWAINQIFSPVIEFSLGRFDGEVLRSGRLYYIDSYYDEKKMLVGKPADFIEWSRQLFRKVKRLLMYDKDLGAYLGNEAVEMRDSGIELRQF
jgi:hypothetical protein